MIGVMSPASGVVGAIRAGAGGGDGCCEVKVVFSVWLRIEDLSLCLVS